MTRSDGDEPVINFLDFFRFMEEDGSVTAYYGGADGHFNPEVCIHCKDFLAAKKQL